MLAPLTTEIRSWMHWELSVAIMMLLMYMSEVIVKGLKNNKAVGNDGIPSEVHKVKCCVFYGQEPRSGESTITECGFNYQLLAVIHWSSPMGSSYSCSQQPQPAMDNGVRDGRSNWLVAPSTLHRAVPPELHTLHTAMLAGLQITTLTALSELWTCDLWNTRPTHCLCGHSGYKFASERLLTMMSIFLSGCMLAGKRESTLMNVVIIPLLKCKSKDVAHINNYRAIAIATALSKILEQVLLSRIARYLQTADSQFGFKQAHGTEMAIFALKQTVDFYHNNY